jgi:hypothetical protein
MNQKRSRSGSLLNYFKVESNTTPNVELPESKNQKPPITAENSSTINNTATDIPNESNIQLNEGNNIVPKFDISLYVNKKLSDHEKINIIQNMWVPDNSYIFKTQQIGSQNRKFNRFWLTKYKWLAYSKLENSVYCKTCVLFAPSYAGNCSSQALNQLVKTGYNNWKNALERFEKHSFLNYHKDASLKYDTFIDIMSGKLLSIDKKIDKDSQKQALDNQEKLKPIIKTVILCGRQNLSLRSHRDYGVFSTKKEPAENEGNFRALLRARIESGDESLKKHFETCGKNATYISWNIQNQIIEACDEIIIKKLVTKINKAKFFSVLADETTDVSTVEQFSLCVRFVELMSNNEYKIVEQFLKFVPVQSTTGQRLADVILETLNNIGIDLNFLRGQGYDGASSMSGQFKGVQALITNKYPTAIYVHCVSHSLNLALSNAAEVVPIRNAFGILEKIYTFFNTPKRQDILQHNIETSTYNSNKTKLKQLCPTRWVERHDSVIILKQMLLPVVAALEEIQSWSCKDSSSNAFLLLCGIRQSSFIISLLCAEKLLSYTLPISKILQSTDLDISEALNNVDSVISVLQNIRTNVENEFKIIFNEACEIADALEITIAMPRLTKNQTKRCNVPSENEEEYYKRAIFIPWLDSFINSISERFLKHKDVIKSFKCLLPTGHIPNQTEKSQYSKLLEFYKNDIPQNGVNAAAAEFDLWYQKFAHQNHSLPHNAIDALNLCNDTLFQTIFILLKIFSTLPVSTSTTERSFSSLRRIKTYLRNTMSQNRLNGLAMLHIHREIDVQTSEVLSILGKKGPRRLNFVV